MRSPRLTRILLWPATLALVAAACTAADPDPTTPVPTSPGTVTSTTTDSPGSSTTAVQSTTTVQTTTTTRPQVPVPTWVDENGFDDHSVPRIESVLEYFALSRTGVSGQAVVKFTIADFSVAPEIWWMDAAFYELHDEWYWFRLLNGADVPGSSFAPAPASKRTTSV